jgi:hypothetical protein
MSSSATIPGLYYAFVRPPAAESPLRTDVAGFFGLTKRGPAGQAVRVEGWREFVNVFGGLQEQAHTPYAVRGYFDNWAQTAFVVRLLGDSSATAGGLWTAGSLDKTGRKPDQNWPGDSRLPALAFNLKASSPGEWANGMTFVVRFWARAASGNPELEIEITPSDEPAELLTGIHPETVVEEVNAQSLYVNLSAVPLPAGITSAELRNPRGPRYREWPAVSFSGGTTLAASRKQFLSAVTALGDTVEVALVVSPDLYNASLAISPDDQMDVISALLTQAEDLHDRQVILDVPPDNAATVCAVKWVQYLREFFLDEHLLRHAAVYHPPILMPDPLGTLESPLRSAPNSGFVTGVISRLDKQLGPYATPANAQIYEAVDLTRSLNPDEQTALYEGGINLLKCSPGRGLLVWGGRVLGALGNERGGFLAHRRIIHVLVRAIRRVAEPLVFDTNGPQLWLAFVRSLTSVLLEAYRAGALKGSRPEEAFRVKCDAETNPPDQVDNGLCICEVQVAPAVPMEFITLRVAASGDGTLEVFET